VRVEGLIFAGLGADDPAGTSGFLADALGAPVEQEGEVRRLLFPNGSSLAVVPRDWLEGSSDTLLGFLVDDLEAAGAELPARGVEPEGELHVGYGYRYRHFRAPGGRRFELLEKA
jgi:hypothetical protein